MAVFLCGYKNFFDVSVALLTVIWYNKKAEAPNCFVRRIIKLLSHIRRHKYEQFFMKVKYNFRKNDYI